MTVHECFRDGHRSTSSDTHSVITRYTRRPMAARGAGTDRAITRRMRRIKLAVSAMALFGMAACNNNSPVTPSTGTTLNVVLTDSPFSDAQAVLVTFSAVSVHMSSGAFTTLPFADGASSRTCDLKKLQGANDVLGTGTLPPGHYTEIRLAVASAAIYFDNVASGSACASSIAAPAGRAAAVTIPSGDVRLNRPFDVINSTTTTITLDFDGDQSLTHTGSDQYVMHPVIGVVSVQ